MNYVKENIKALRALTRMKQKEFAEMVSATRGMIADYETGGSNPKSAVVDAIHKIFGVSRQELFETKIDVGKIKWDGVGKTTSDTSQSSGTTVEARSIAESDFMQVPILSTYAQAGYLRGGADIEEEKRFDIMLMPREYEKGHYLVVEIQGDSMRDGTERSLIEGEKFLVKELDKIYWKEKLLIHRYVWVIVHREGIAFKEIIHHDVEKGIITCHSWNPVYKDYKVNLKDVYRLFYVKKSIDRIVKP